MFMTVTQRSAKRVNDLFCKQCWLLWYPVRNHEWLRKLSHLSVAEFCLCFWLSTTERQRLEKGSPGCLGKMEFVLGKQITLGCPAPDLEKPCVPAPLGQAHLVGQWLFRTGLYLFCAAPCTLWVSNRIGIVLPAFLVCFISGLTIVWLYLPEITSSYNIVQILSISFFLSDEIGSEYQLPVL